MLQADTTRLCFERNVKAFYSKHCKLNWAKLKLQPQQKVNSYFSILLFYVLNKNVAFYLAHFEVKLSKKLILITQVCV